MPRNRILFHFDPDDVIGGEPAPDVGGAEAGDGSPSAEPALLAGDGQEPSSAWAPSRDEWEAAQEELAEFRAMVEQARQWDAQQQPDPGYEPPAEDLSLDPFSDDFGDRLSTLLDRKLEQIVGVVEQRLQPLTETHMEQRRTEAEERAKDILTDIAAQTGEFNQDLARKLAEGILPETRQRYGNGPRAAEAALRQAASLVREIEQAAEQRGVERFKNQMSRVGGAPSEPGGQGTAIVGVPDARDEVELARRLTGAY